MRIFVTAGNTEVMIDRVRCITNIFTGRTGALIALEAYRRGHDITLLTSHPEVVQLPKSFERFTLMVYRTFEDLDDLMANCVSSWQPQVIIHCAAVADYLPAGIFAATHEGDALTMHDRSAPKVKSDEPELWLRLVRAPKLADKIRSEWNFRGLLVKFKLEVGITETDLQKIAEKSRQQSQADWMVANVLGEPGASATAAAADWALVGNADGYQRVSRDRLSSELLDRLESQVQRG